MPRRLPGPCWASLALGRLPSRRCYHLRWPTHVGGRTRNQLNATRPRGWRKSGEASGENLLRHRATSEKSAKSLKIAGGMPLAGAAAWASLLFNFRVRALLRALAATKGVGLQRRFSIKPSPSTGQHSASEWRRAGIAEVCGDGVRGILGLRASGEGLLAPGVPSLRVLAAGGVQLRTHMVCPSCVARRPSILLNRCTSRRGLRARSELSVRASVDQGGGLSGLEDLTGNCRDFLDLFFIDNFLDDVEQ
ncbi:MAG: hypothetical protein RJA70_5000 [Pseudomonadota bacterium]